MIVRYRPDIRREVRIDTGSRRPYFRGVYFVAAFIVVIILFLPGPVSAGEGFSVLGVEFPVMVDDDWLLDSDVVSFSTFHLKFDLHFYLSPQGTVDSFTYSPHSPQSRQIYIDRITNSLENIHFHPARINDTAVSFILPAELLFSQKFGKRYADLRLPYNEPECHKSELLIEKALRLNGFALPGVKRFPSYFCSLKGEGDFSDYSFTVFEIEFDSSGALVEFHDIQKTGNNNCDLISNSLLYAEFLPASYKGRNFAGRFYLVARFFEEVNYPTSVWPPSVESGVNLPFDYIRIGSRLYLDTIVNPPFPLNVRAGRFRHDTVVPFADTFEVLIEVDTLGSARPLEYRAYMPNRLRDVVKIVIGRLRFTPARGLTGAKEVFEGSVLFSTNFSKYIRIAMNWLPPEAQVDIQ